MDDDAVRVPGASDGAAMMTATAPAGGGGGSGRAADGTGGTRVAVKKEAMSTASPAFPTPGGSKDDTASPSLSPEDVKPSPTDSVSTPDTSAAAAAKPPAAARKASAMLLQHKSSRSATPSATARPLFDQLPDATTEATSQFQIITDCLYGSKHMGSSDHDAFDCDCAEEWHSDCINRATKMECVEGDCNCGEGCQNQRFQRKQYARVSVIKTEKKGFGLRADADLSPNDFVFEYIGEVINEPAFRRRMLQYDEEGIKHFYFMSLTKSEFVDATRKGNLGRFCNHSCNPNCYVDKWVVGDKLRMGIFAGRHIRAGEELVFDYNVDRYGADPQPCYCAEPNCTGYIGGKTQTERATKLSQATIEALGIDDPDGWDTAVAKKQRRKKPNEDDEEYVGGLQQAGLAEDGVTKVMAALMQCKEKWIAVKLLARIQAARDDERVLNRVVRMHGYQILCSILATFKEDDNVVLQVLDILYRFPRLTKNKISDSNIESVIETFTTSHHEDVAAGSKRLLLAWSKLETAYRIPRKKFDPHAPASAFEDRRGRDVPQNDGAGAGDDAGSIASSRKRAPLSPLHGMVVPRGPRSNVPQRNTSFFNNSANGGGTPRNARMLKNGISSNIGGSNIGGSNNGSSQGALPPGWFTATDPNGTTYYYTKNGATTWKRPTQPADKAVAPLPKAPSKAQQEMDAVQEIINSLTKELARPSASHTPPVATTPGAEPKQEKWRSLSLEKQKKIYENTLFPHIKSVTDRFRNQLPKEEIKKFGKEISKKLVASDYKNNRVEDPNVISSRQRKKVKAYVQDFFERAANKYQEHEKKKAERQGHQAATDRKEGPPSSTAHPTSGTEVAAPATNGASGHVSEDPGKDDEPAALDDMDVSDGDDADGAGDAAPSAAAAAAAATFSPDSSSDRKRKRVDSAAAQDAKGTDSSGQGGGPSSTGTPSEAPSLKRLKDEDAVLGQDTPTPPTPPPPPPPPPPPLPPAAEEDDGAEAESRAACQRDDVALRQREEEEAALRRENEEAMRDFEEQSKQPKPVAC